MKAYQNLVITGSLNVSGALLLNGSPIGSGSSGSGFPYSGSAVITGSLLTSGSQTITGSLEISGSQIITGSLEVSGSITGSLFGTSSYSTTASYALNAAGGTSVIISASAPTSKSVGTLWFNTKSDTASGGDLFVQMQDPIGNSWVPVMDNITAYSVSSSYTDSSSIALSSSVAISSSYALTASFVPGAPYRIGTNSGVVPFKVEATASGLSDIILGGLSGSSTFRNIITSSGAQLGGNSIIGNGYGHIISGASFGTILNGTSNRINSASGQSTIANGGSNLIEGSSNSFIAGASSTISSTNSFYSANAIVGGEGNIISQSRNVIAGGYFNTVSASNFSVVMGQSVSAVGRDNAIVLGKSITASYDNTLHTNNLFVSGNVVGGFKISGSQTITGSLNITGSQTLTGSLRVSGSITGSLEGDATYTKGRYAYWAPYLSTDPSGMGASYNAAVAVNGGENGIWLTNTGAGGNANINWSSTKIDWTKDFKMSAVVYIINTPGVTVGDGFVFYAGTTAPVYNVYGNDADNGLKFRLFTYAFATDQTNHLSGSTFWLNTTKGPQGRMNTNNSMGIWATYTVEVATDRVTNKRMALAYMQNNVDYGGKWPLAAMDVTSWVPTGNNFGFFCSTGGAKENLYINSITFEAL
jgi:hypothetical protein